MLKSGLFTTPEGVFTVYEVDCYGYNRIDFMEPNAVFQVDVTKVIYSRIHKRNTYTYGNSKIYDEYLRIRGAVAMSNIKGTSTKEWLNGVYTVVEKKEDPSSGVQMTISYANGNMTSEVLSYQGYTISMIVVDEQYNIKIDPTNFDQYITLALSNDTVAEASNGIFYSADVLKRRYGMGYLDKYDLVFADVNNMEKRLWEFVNSKHPFVAVDTETTGLEVNMYDDDYLVGIILGNSPTSSTYFPFRHKANFNLPEEFIGEISKAIISQQHRAVAHNKKFDRKVFLKEGYDVHIKWDTFQLDFVRNPTIGRNIHGEKVLASAITGQHTLELEEIFVNPKDINFALLDDPEVIKMYACPDGINPLLIIEDQLKTIPKKMYPLAELECDLSDLKADMEYYGIRVNMKKYLQQYKNCEYILDALLKAFRVLTHSDGNINSGDYLRDLIYNKMRCPVLSRTDTGLASTSKAAIIKLSKKQAKNEMGITEDLVDLNGKVIIKAADLAKSAYPALVILAKYKDYIKLKTAFYARFERTVKTGRVFFWVNQNGAATGRQSSPMHQLPQELKDCILSDAPDRDFWGPDYSQIELRMIAYLAGEKDLIDLATNPDNDIHRVIGSLITGKPMWAITAQERQDGKRRNFGVVYTISKYGLAGQMFGPGYTQENIDFCENQIFEFFHRFKRIDRFIKMNAVKVQKYGYMETKWFHRRRNFELIFDPNLEPAKRASIIRMANNVPVQGTAADYMKVGEVRMYTYIYDKGWNVPMEDGFPKVRIMLSIHDEIIISAHQSIAYEEIVKMIRDCMETPVEGAPPFFVQPARMANWGQHSDDAVAFPIRYRDKVIEEFEKTHESVFKNSYFRLVIPETTMNLINESKEPASNLANALCDTVTLEFDHGDYGTEFTPEHVKDALFQYITSGSMIYRIDNYLDNLNEFRDGMLYEYMHNLIQKYGTDYKVVGPKVRHDSLTFELLSVEKKRLPDGLSHEDQITEAAKLYIEDYLSGAIHVAKKFEARLKDVSVPSDKDLFTEQLEPLVEFDDQGEVIYSEDEELNDETVSEYFYDDPDDIIARANNKPIYVWELADVITFDVQSLKQTDVDKVLSYIFQQKEDDGFFKIMLLYNDKLLDTKMRIERMDVDAANTFVSELVEKGAMACMTG